MTAKITTDYAVDPDRVHLTGISAGAAMAALVAVAYPETYASVAFHSGIAWKAATNVMAALGVMAKGVADARTLGSEAAVAMGGRARWIPALVIQGGSDKVVNPANADGLAQQWMVMNMVARGEASTAPADDDPRAGGSSGETNGYHWKRSILGAGPDIVEKLVVAELGHAWSGGSSMGTFTDEHGPDATAEMLAFFRTHPRTGTR
jgi:poly(3-hydroxybutyrate) depolymerase